MGAAICGDRRRAGRTVAGARLRQLAPDAAITLIGAEPAPPYQRPPLSKAYLLGEMEEERLFCGPSGVLRRPEDHACSPAPTVTAIDPAAQTVTLPGGDSIAYDRLALTTGSLPRTLPAAIGGELRGRLHGADAGRCRPDGGRSSPPAGACWWSAAAISGSRRRRSRRRRGWRSRWSRWRRASCSGCAAAETSDYFRAAHRAHGVDMREGIGLARLTGAGHVDRRRAGGRQRHRGRFRHRRRRHRAGHRAGRGGGAGLRQRHRGRTRFCRTSDPAIWAAGDCASFPGRAPGGCDWKASAMPSTWANARPRTWPGTAAPYLREAVVLVGSVRHPAADRRAVHRLRPHRHPPRRRRPGVVLVLSPATG